MTVVVRDVVVVFFEYFMNRQVPLFPRRFCEWESTVNQKYIRFSIGCHYGLFPPPEPLHGN